MKIFISVGSQLPFDRMVSAIDRWALDKPELEFFAQIGNTKYIPVSFRKNTIVAYDVFKSAFERADLVISHAGIGNIILALEIGKPIIIMPRLYSFMEVRNDHQLGTVKAFTGKLGIHIAKDETHLPEIIDEVIRVITMSNVGCSPVGISGCDEDLIAFLSDFIES